MFEGAVPRQPPPLPLLARRPLPAPPCPCNACTVSQLTRCQANLGHTGQSRSDPGLGFQVKVLDTIQLALSLLSSRTHVQHLPSAKRTHQGRDRGVERVSRKTLGRPHSPLLLNLTEVPLLLRDVPPSTFVSVSSALPERQSRSKGNGFNPGIPYFWHSHSVPRHSQSVSPQAFPFGTQAFPFGIIPGIPIRYQLRHSRSVSIQAFPFGINPGIPIRYHPTECQKHGVRPEVRRLHASAPLAPYSRTMPRALW